MTLPETGYVRLPQIIGDRKRNIVGVYPVSRAHWYAGIKAGRYPAAVKNGHISFWRVEDIRALIESLAA